MTDGTTRRPSTHVPILVLVQLAFAWRFWFVCDDAYITYRYAQNWAFGYGLVFNRGEFPPVEGYSDFLWLVLAAITERLTLPTDLLLPLLSVACGTALVLKTYQLMYERLGIGRVPSFLAALTLAASPAFGVWSTSGLETMPQALLTLLLFEDLALKHEDDDNWALAALYSFLLATIRTEGLGWVAVADAAAFVVLMVDRRPLLPLVVRMVKIAVPLVACLGVYQGWRFWYYGTLVPNTALVKVGFGAKTLWRGLKYVLLFELTTLVPAISLLGTFTVSTLPRRGLATGITMVAIAFPVYAVVVGGDFMPFGRMMIPGLSFAAMLLGLFLQEIVRQRNLATAARVGWAVVAIGVLPALDLHLVPESVRHHLHFRLTDKEYLSEFNRWENQRDNAEAFAFRGLALSQIGEEGDAVVAAAVGAIGYFSDLEILDQHGLVTKEIAFRPMPEGPLTESPGHDKHVEPSFFAKYQPRWLYARALWGKLAAGRMKDTLDQWQVDPAVMSRYVPDYYEVTLPGVQHRAFLLVVRLRDPLEDPTELWTGFANRRRSLNAELRAEYDERTAEESEDPDLSDPLARPTPIEGFAPEEGEDGAEDGGDAGLGG